jgi:MFS family permease
MNFLTDHPLSKQDYKTLLLSALGGALEFYDFIIFVFFSEVIGVLFFPVDISEWLRRVQTFAIFAVGYLARPLGGIIIAHFGDKFGRKKMFNLSIMLMALPTLAMSLLPVYTSIGIAAPPLMLTLRVLQGAAIGGEVPGAWVFVAEHVPVKRMGFACGILSTGLTVGILLGSLVATTVNTLLSPADIIHYGWRIPFFIGGIFGLFAMYLRHWLQETPVFQEIQQHKFLADKLPIQRLLTSHKRSIVISILLTGMLAASIVLVILMAPTLMQEQHMISAALSQLVNSFATIMMMLGCIIVGRLVDHFGAPRVLIIGSFMLAISCWNFFNQLDSTKSMLFVWYGLGGLSVGITGLVPFVMVQLFPAEVRFTGISFSYNIGYAIAGGLTPICVTLIMFLTKMTPAWYILVISGIGQIVGLWLWYDHSLVKSQIHEKFG